MYCSANFQRLMSNFVDKIKSSNILVNLDDIIIISKKEEENLKLLERIFDILKKYGFNINLPKITLFTDEIDYLGHVISKNGVSIDSEKVKVTRSWSKPECSKQLERLLVSVDITGHF